MLRLTDIRPAALLLGDPTAKKPSSIRYGNLAVRHQWAVAQIPAVMLGARPSRTWSPSVRRRYLHLGTPYITSVPAQSLVMGTRHRADGQPLRLQAGRTGPPSTTGSSEPQRQWRGDRRRATKGMS